MLRNIFCQSCGMPIENMEDQGTEGTGIKSQQYCKYCYVDGKFTQPEITLEQMKGHVETIMKGLDLSQNVIHLSLSSLPHLKRWKEKVDAAHQAH